MNRIIKLNSLLFLLILFIKNSQAQVNFTLGVVDQPDYNFANAYTIELLNQLIRMPQQQTNATPITYQNINVQRFTDQRNAQRCLQLNTCTAIIDTQTLIQNDTSRMITIQALSEPIIGINPPIYKQIQEVVIVNVIQWLFGIFVPFIALITLIANIIPSSKQRIVQQQQRITATGFIQQSCKNFVSTYDFYINERIPLLGVFWQIAAFFMFVYLIMLVSFDVTQIFYKNQKSLSLNALAYASQQNDQKLCIDSRLQNLLKQNYFIDQSTLTYSSNVKSCIDSQNTDYNFIVTKAYSFLYQNNNFNLKDHSISIFNQVQEMGLIFLSIPVYQTINANLQNLDQKNILFSKFLTWQNGNFLAIQSDFADQLIASYLPIHYAGYAFIGLFLLIILLTALIIKLCFTQPNFIKYDENNQNDPDLIDSQPINKAEDKQNGSKQAIKLQEDKFINNVSKKLGGESLKLEEEPDNIEFVQEGGRPDNFLGLQDVSSGDQEQKFKYGCTDDLEEALSSVQLNSGNQNRNMYTGSESLDDILRGYLKSGKALESKLQQISSLKNAIKSLEYNPGRQSINEQPADDEIEEDDPPANENSHILVQQQSNLASQANGSRQQVRNQNQPINNLNRI